MQLLKPLAFTMCRKVRICVAEFILIKGFKQSLSLTQSLTSGCAVGCQNINFDSCQDSIGDSERGQ